MLTFYIQSIDEAFRLAIGLPQFSQNVFVDIIARGPGRQHAIANRLRGHLGRWGVGHPTELGPRGRVSMSRRPRGMTVARSERTVRPGSFTSRTNSFRIHQEILRFIRLHATLAGAISDFCPSWPSCRLLPLRSSGSLRCAALPAALLRQIIVIHVEYFK